MSYLISSPGYVNQLLDMFNEIKKENYLKNEYYEIFINFIELLNKKGFIRKEFSRYHSKIYFERAFYSMKKNFNESDYSMLDEAIKKRFNTERMIAETEFKKINSFTELFERKIKNGEFLNGNFGFNGIGKKIDRFIEDMSSMTYEEIEEILDIFKNMADSFDKTKKTIGELFCICNVIIINNFYFEKGYKQLWQYINRYNTLVNSFQYENYEWLYYAKEIIEKIS